MNSRSTEFAEPSAHYRLPGVLYGAGSPPGLPCRTLDPPPATFLVSNGERAIINGNGPEGPFRPVAGCLSTVISFLLC